jgi:hypothetical protein
MLLPNNSVPAVGTSIPIEDRSIVLSRDQRTHVCRIKYLNEESRWIMVPARVNKRGALINHGLLVFLKKQAAESDTHIRITSIQPSGKGAYAEPVQL